MSTRNKPANAGSKPTQALQQQVTATLEQYFAHLDGEDPNELYNLVLEQMELPLLKTVMQYVRGNQCRAAKVLGMSRGTLRKKLKHYNLD